MSDRPHSAEYFGDDRDHWWNADFAALMARRWELSRVRALLDVGCGVGHFTRVLQPHLPAGARVVGVDREPRWVRAAEERTPGGRFVRGEAQRLPFPDASFDAAVCQTLLIHVPDPAAVIAEMVRVVRPGGIVIAAEPNNVFGSIPWSASSHREDPAAIAAILEFWLVVHRGKVARGEGDLAVGERLPSLFGLAGLRELQVHLNDRAALLHAPYDDPAQAAMLEAARGWFERGEGPWDRAELWARFEAGGGRPALFDRALAELERIWREDERARQDGSYVSAGGAVCYLVAGRKPRVGGLTPSS